MAKKRSKAVQESDERDSVRNLRIVMDNQEGSGLENGGEWASIEMSGADLPDDRYIMSAARNAHRLASHCGESFSAACGPDGRQAASRLFHDERLTIKGLLHGHFLKTAERCKQHKVVIVADDTSAYNFTTHRVLVGLGNIGDSVGAKGLFGHAALAMTPGRLPLGLLDLQLWAREADEDGKAKNRRQRRFEEKESVKWLRSLQSVEKYLPKDQEVYIVTDRESDIFAYIAAPRRITTHLIVRACQPRNVEVVTEDGQDLEEVKSKLFDVRADAPEVSTLEVTVGRKPGQKERKAHVSVRAAEVYLLPPVHLQDGESSTKQKVTVIWAIETNPPTNVGPDEVVDWTLLSTDDLGHIPEQRGAKACTLLYYYSLRWEIERLHYTLKSGCNVQKLQIEPLSALMNALAFYHIVAWRVLRLTHLDRQAPDTPVETEFSPDEVAALSGLARKPVKTIGQAMPIIAKLAGHEAYRSGPLPGVKRIWLGLRALSHLVQGYRLGRDSPAPKSA